jgi:hypothetical protein
MQPAGAIRASQNLEEDGAWLAGLSRSRSRRTLIRC